MIEIISASDIFPYDWEEEEKEWKEKEKKEITLPTGGKE